MTPDPALPAAVNVIVVGAGPVGLALAGDLGWRGVSCLVLERSDGTITQPRMDGVGVRTMEFCRRWGISSWVADSPYPRDLPQDNVYVTSMSGFELAREPMPAPGDDPGPPQSPERRERCPQDMFDPILRRFAQSLPTVTLAYRTDVVGVSETDGGVEVRVRDRSGAERTLRSDYVVGCDGAGSTVRRQVGIEMSGEDVLTYSTNVIFRCPDLFAVCGKPRGYRFICIGPEGTYATIVAINGRDRWRLSIIGDGRQRALSDEEVEEAIQRAVGARFAFEIESTVPWARREAVAESYRSGRILLAGDAAHVMSPTGGFGMNTGIGDAVDLGWKLDALLRGWGGEHLLDSYERERKPVAQRNAQESSQNLRNLLAPRTQTPPEAVFLSDEEDGAQARARYGAWFKQLVRREWFSVGAHLGYEYNDSSIIFTIPGRQMGEDITSYVQTSAPGARAPHAWIGEGRSTLDLFGSGFVLLRLGGHAPGAEGLIASAAHHDVPLEVIEIDDPVVRELYEHPLVLVRPDGFVAWRSRQDPDDPDEIIGTVSGATTREAAAVS